jgi:hypothetical protein
MLRFEEIARIPRTTNSMKKPDFLKIIYSSLILDLVLLVLCLFAGYGIYLILAVMLYIVPIYVGVLGVKGALEWTNGECRADGLASSTSRLLCGSSLAYLLLATGMVVWGDLPKDSNLFAILAYIYLLVLVLRFSGAALLNIVASVPCLILGRGVDRLSAVSALLCSAAGLHMTFGSMPSPNPEDYKGFAIFAVINFGYGLVYGGGVQWLVRELSQPDERLP